MSSFRTGLLLLFLSSICVAQDLWDVELDIPELGKLTGSRFWKSTINKRTIYSYRGVPFGKPPVGDLRFKASGPYGPWAPEVPIWNAKPFGRICTQTAPFLKENEKPQFNFWEHIYNSEDYRKAKVDVPFLPEKGEDCLNLAIYTPEAPGTNAKLPVLIFFHGGAFADGSSFIYWPHHLLDHDMILVVPHYRLGPLGFLSLQTDDIPGNAGMYDQIEAMKWVQNYIHHFGGDKDQVTISGESAGAASVSLHAISDLSKGLFKRIIAQSGSGITEWAIDREPVYNIHGVGKLAGCDHEALSEPDFVQCLKDVNPFVLTNAYKAWIPIERKAGKTGFGGCSPVVQNNPGGDKFLDKMPIDYWRQEGFSPVPAMYGCNKHEGSFIMGMVYVDYMEANGLLNDTDFLRYDAIKVFLDLFLVNDPSYVLQDALEYEYVGVNAMGNVTAMTPGIIDFAGDAFLKGSSWENMKLHAKLSSGNTYWYAFNFIDCATLFPFIAAHDLPFPGGVSHANELPFVFNVPVISDFYTPAEKVMSKQIAQLWYNYVAFEETQPDHNLVEGVPPEWKPYNVTENSYVRFDKVNSMQVDYTKEYTIARDEDFGLLPPNIPDYCWYKPILPILPLQKNPAH